MFDTDFILWLQSWASPSLTAIMNAVSLLGYTRAYVAITALLAFTWRLRPAAALIVLLALNAVLTDSAKIVAAMPRPDAIDKAVHAFGMTPWPGALHGGADVENYGFPSGHVSATVTFVLGLMMIFRWKRAWLGLVAWLPLMALSRVYLGRHFLGDLAGGAIVGVIASALDGCRRGATHRKRVSDDGCAADSDACRAANGPPSRLRALRRDRLRGMECLLAWTKLA